MTEEIWVGIDGERIKLEGEALEKFIAERDAYLELEAKLQAEFAEKQAQRKAILERLGLTEDEAKILLG